MDNPNFGSSHLSSPALVVFSQAANGLSDALRLQRPFHSQLQDAKDLHHLSLVSSYGTHLLHGFQPHFLHQHLNPAVSSANSSPFGSGGAFVKPFPSNLSLPSAFAPPKCLGFGLDQFSKFKGLLFGSGNNAPSTNGGSESFRTDSSSPACASLSPPAKDESMEGQTSEEGDRDRLCSPTRSPETPGFRRIGPKKPLHVGATSATGHNSCPICGIQLSPDELESHFSAELGRLAKPNMYNERQEIRRTLSMELHAVQSSLQSRSSRWETFQRIRVNRQGRLRGKLRKRKFEEEAYANMTCQSCPVCHGRLQRTQEEIAQHIEECVRKQNSQTQIQDEDETVDVESYGEETSNGAINMTSQLYNNNNNSVNNNNNNSNQVINNNNNIIMHNKIDKTTPEDHTITSLNRTTANWDHKSRMSLNLSCTQINENGITRVTPTSSDQRITDVEYELDNDRDRSQERMSDNEEEVIVDNTDDENDCGMKRKQSQPSAQRLVNGLREMKKSTEEATSSVEIDSATESNNQIIARTPNDTTPNSDSYVSTSEAIEPPASKAQVLEELKARIRELEGSPHYKCFICKEKCKTFIISTICGHYLCEDCWITVSDIEKQCPRCKIATLNIDFRKISCLN
ncbi:CLUMA_CG017988, isoform A [Clunio marinus]|uniref:CLUMA_CG017988, isoform A n=1 Tax=Clunio marinus TaxID=568069 RepID=A0A1J1J0Z1_9DIPT|nr:CLUMA_CG017988, isoform A [Clunio marinus]